MKIFRWQGVVVLVVLAVLIGGFFIFFFDSLMKVILEKSLGAALQRPVEIQKFQSKISSLQFGIYNIQIADKKDPFKNIAQIDKLEFNLDGKKLAFKKYNIENLSIEGIKFNTKRKKPAFVKEEKKEEEKKSKLSIKSFSEKLKVPSAKEILKREKLKTVEVGKEYQEKLKKMQEKWKKQYAEIQKEKEDIKKIQEEINFLKKKVKKIKSIDDIKKITSTTKQLQKEIKQKLAKIKALKKEIENDKKVLQKAYADLQEAYKYDLKHLKEKYSLNMEGGVNLAGLIFGDQVKNYLDKAISVYKTISPYLKKGEEKQKEIEQKNYRLEGKYVKYKELHPYPDIVVEEGKLSLVAFNSNISGTLKDFSDNQKIYGKPFQLTFSSENGSLFKKFYFHSVFDRTKKISIDSFKTKIDDLKSKDYEIKNFVKFTNNKLAVRSDINVKNEKELSGYIKLIFEKTEPVVIRQDSSGEIIKKLFEGINKFYVGINLSGEIDKPSIKIQSDLDEMVSKRLRKLIKAKIDKFNKELNNQIAKQKEQYTKEIKKYQAEIDRYKNQLKQYENKYKSILKDIKEKYGEKALKNQIKKKLFKSFGF